MNCWTKTVLGVLILLAWDKNTLADSPRDIAQQAKAVTVSIQGEGYSQTGVLVGQTQGNYWVLTCQSNNTNFNNAQIRLGDHQSYPLITTQTRRLPDTPLTILVFSSNRAYSSATLGDWESLAVGDRLYVAGFLPGDNEQNSPFQFTEGIISSLLNSSSQGNYGFTHTSFIHRGMVGNPIFDSEGALIGMDCNTKPPLNLANQDQDLHWGISVHNFRDFAQKEGISSVFSAFGSPPFPNP